MKVGGSYETSANFDYATRCHVPEDNILNVCRWWAWSRTFLPLWNLKAQLVFKTGLLWTLYWATSIECLEIDLHTASHAPQWKLRIRDPRFPLAFWLQFYMHFVDLPNVYSSLYNINLCNCPESTKWSVQTLILPLRTRPFYHSALFFEFT